MKKVIGIFLITFSFSSCHKNETTLTGCDIQKVYADNAKKVTITHGIWGTVSSLEGDCMPTTPPSTSGCKNCPVKRTVVIYQYTLFTNATPLNNSTGFFDSFNTSLVAQVDTDENGFFQINVPEGHYTIAIIENGKLYANSSDGQGGLNPFTLTNGLEEVDVTMTYKAEF